MAIESTQEGYSGSFDQLSQAQFDPVQFLNETLPALNLTNQVSSSKQTRTTILQSTSTDVQAFLLKLNTHSVRSSSDLTVITDEILRGGNRLAYEVEVLRGDVSNLYELLTDSLKEDISRFVFDEATQQTADSLTAEVTDAPALGVRDDDTTIRDPEFIRQLRLLGNVKSRLEAVIHVFGEALKWPIAPSEVSMATSLISVSAPEFGMASSSEDDKARDYTKKLRDGIIEVLDSDGGGLAGLEAASNKVNDIRDLSQLWKGTVEERARNRVVEGLANLVEERKKLLETRSAPPRSNTDGSGARSSSMPGRAGRLVEGSTNTAAGLFRNLQKLRDEIYLD